MITTDAESKVTDAESAAKDIDAELVVKATDGAKKLSVRRAEGQRTVSVAVACFLFAVIASIKTTRAPSVKSVESHVAIRFDFCSAVPLPMR